jgi:transcriptional regulator with XRE-family HTH domain
MLISGMSARQLAIALAEQDGPSVTRTTIGDYLNGETSPPANILVAIAEALNVDAAWLLTGRGHAPAMAYHPASIVPRENPRGANERQR